VFEQVFALLPEGLATTPPGAALGALLDQVDPREVSPHDTVVLAAAWRRQLSHHEARFALAAREVARADTTRPGGRAESYGEFCTDELRALLCESRTRVTRLLGQADTAIAAIPELWAAWDTGRLDTDRVRICVTWTSSLCDEHARAVVLRVLPDAPGLTLSGLIERIQQLATAIDPAWAARLYDNARRQRRVRARRTESGTLNVSGLDLPLDAGALSVAHIETLALRAKAAGHPGLLDTIRAEVYLALLSPRPHTARGWDDGALVAHVVAHADPDDPRGLPTPRHVGAHGPGPGGGDPTPDPIVPTPDDPGNDGPPASGSAPDEPAPDEPAPDEPAPDEPAGARLRGSRRTRIEMRIGLLTLLGLDEKPGTMPGYGIVHAPFARQFARRLAHAEWRVAVTDDDGHLLAALITRRRPQSYATTPDTATPAARPVLELHISEKDLTRPGLRPGVWAGVFDDLRDQLDTWTTPPHDPDTMRRRFPPAALARWTQMRDRSCVFPPCRASSLVADIDHTIAVTDHGRTLAGNLDALCSHDHRLKHDGGWHLEQPTPGRFTWTSPTGHRYDRPPRPITPDVPRAAPGHIRSGTTPPEFATDESAWINDPYPDDPPAKKARNTDHPAPHGRPPPDQHDDPGEDQPPF
jgi:hypothetical protein